MQRTFATRVLRIGLAMVAMAMSACGLEKQTQPSLIGPGNGGLSISMSASPDSLQRDGSSQSVVTLTARDSQGQGVAGQRLSLSLGLTAPQGATLSAGEVVTNAAGQATFAVGAPVPGSIGDIAVLATPVGSDASNSRPRQIVIRALPQNNAPPDFPCTQQSSACVLPFSINPAIYDSSSNTWGGISASEAITFDASCSPATTCVSRGAVDEGVPCNACTFTWNFGGDGTATGAIARHAFSAAGNYQITLTVTDSAGMPSVVSAILVVSGISIPTNVAVTSSPVTPIAKQAASFTVTATPATNHRITSYQFIWGDGDSITISSNVYQHTYSQADSYLLTVTVRDDLGQSTTINKVVTVSSGLTADFNTSKSGTIVTFDATPPISSSQAASTITDYAWDFDNDGTYDTNGSSSVVSHDFGSNGTYIVRLRITDNRGVQQTTTKTITLP
jgi:PKD domain-containing protein